MNSNITSQCAAFAKTTSGKLKVPFALSLLALACMAIWCYERANAVAYNWTNAAGGSWTTDGNWDNPGDPDDSSDTATFGNIAGAYTTTLSSPRLIGGLNVSGSDPTLTLSSTLTIQGGASTISGGTINGAGTLRLTNTPTINWTGGTLGGSATILLPTLQSATINNDPGQFALGAGQTIRLGDVANGTSTPSVLTFSNGFANDGEIRLGMNPPGDNFGIFRLEVNSGTLTNNAGGNINLLPRSAGNSGPPWNTREIRSNIQNDGTITVTASDGILGGTGLTVVNTGTINTDHSIFSTTTHVPRVTINGTSFTNTGTLNVGANDGGLGGGNILVNSTTIDLNSGSTITGPGILDLRGATVNINAGTSISGLTTLAFGRTRVVGSPSTPQPTVVNWNIPDLTDPMTFRINANAEVTLNRTGAWNLPANQVLEFYAPDPIANGSATSLTMAEDFNNDGLVRMGRAAPGDNYTNAQLILTGATTFTNNAGGVVDMYPRSAGNDSTPWFNRYISANVVNNGTVNAYSGGGRLGDTGKTVVNNGTINIDSSLLNSPRKAVLELFGDSSTNNGVINLNGGQLWVNTPVFNYDGGSVTSTTGGGIRLGSNSIDVDFIFNGGAEITDPVTWIMNRNTANTITRTSTWNILSGQSLVWETGGGSGALESLTVNQDITNSGLIQAGNPSPGDNFLNHALIVNSTNSRLTNNADGTIVLYPRSATTTGDPWSIRRFEAELINNGQFTSFTHRGFVGKAIAGIDHVNNGTITLDNSQLTGTPQPEINFIGSTLLNNTNGVIEGNGILNVTGTTFNNAGTLSPGLSAGLLTVQGNVNFQSGGTIYIEITGENAVAGVDYDQLIVTGNVNGLNNADLIIDVASSDLDLLGDVLTILTSDNDLSGVEFNSISFAAGNYLYDVTYGDGFVQLSNIESFIPEPSSGCLLLLGLIALRRRNRRKA